MGTNEFIIIDTHAIIKGGAKKSNFVYIFAGFLTLPGLFLNDPVCGQTLLILRGKLHPPPNVDSDLFAKC